jgi:hypothetical protein
MGFLRYSRGIERGARILWPRQSYVGRPLSDFVMLSFIYGLDASQVGNNMGSALSGCLPHDGTDVILLCHRHVCASPYLP